MSHVRRVDDPSESQDIFLGVTQSESIGTGISGFLTSSVRRIYGGTGGTGDQSAASASTSARGTPEIRPANSGPAPARWAIDRLFDGVDRRLRRRTGRSRRA